ncbi:MAG: hypothetical protein KKA65_00620 [Nanoarchaeota archaeon]|nr:hypothetical protein [Nanoarchaeota archaeon]MBU4455982.1 hypothetical protein [Nanoarchaeota archaeon]MCG2719868.1 hypothetical protein [Nanoarchaeota archaeon]
MSKLYDLIKEKIFDLEQKKKRLEKYKRNYENLHFGILPNHYKGTKEDYWRLVFNNERAGISRIDTFQMLHGSLDEYTCFHILKKIAGTGEPLAEKIAKKDLHWEDLKKEELIVITKLVSRTLTEEEYNQALKEY